MGIEKRSFDLRDLNKKSMSGATSPLKKCKAKKQKKGTASPANVEATKNWGRLAYSCQQNSN